MSQTLGYVTLVVRDYDEAIAFFTNALGFDLIEDTALDRGKRWVHPEMPVFRLVTPFALSPCPTNLQPSKR